MNKDLERELRVLSSIKQNKKDYQIRNFINHLDEFKAVREQLLEEVRKLDKDILTCIKEIEQRKTELDKEHRL